MRIETNHDKCSEAFEECVQMEWSRGSVPVEDASAPTEGLADVNCALCQDALTSPGVVTACQHSYCRNCLKQWIRAARKVSHLCCICRTELFPEPSYRNKDPEGGRSYQHEMNWWNRMLKNVRIVKHWASWLEQKREERRYECTLSSERHWEAI